ncbi:MAG: hypothetical protein ABIE23_03855 [archaeon]
MAEVKVDRDRTVIVLNETERNKLDLSESKEYEIVKAKDDLFLLIGKEKEVPAIPSSDKKIFSLLSGRKNLSQRVEGEFEKLLSKEELFRFNELLKEGIIIKFRLSEKYKKPIYKLKEEPEDKKKAEPLDNPTLEKNHFTVIDNDFEARKFCDRFSREIKENQIKGMKAFDGKFYVLSSSLYEKLKPTIINELKKNKQLNLKQLSINCSLDPNLVRAICEFLREEGEIIEKRKSLYELIG